MDLAKGAPTTTSAISAFAVLDALGGIVCLLLLSMPVLLLMNREEQRCWRRHQEWQRHHGQITLLLLLFFVLLIVLILLHFLCRGKRRLVREALSRALQAPLDRLGRSPNSE